MFHRFLSVLSHLMVAVVAAGFVDGAFSAIKYGQSGPGVFAGVAGTTLAVLVPTVFPTAFLLVLMFGSAGNTGNVFAGIRRLLYPRRVAVRRVGALLTAEVLCFFALFVGVVATSDVVFAGLMHTASYAALSTALVALVCGIILTRLFLSLRRHHIGRIDDDPDGGQEIVRTFAGRVADVVISPGVTVAAVLIAGVSALAGYGDRIELIFDALPVRAVAIVLGGTGFGLTAAVVFDSFVVARTVRMVVYHGIFAISSLLIALAMSGIVVDEEVRFAIKEDGTVSSLAYEVIRDALDFDGDGLLGFMNDGDCAPDNPEISAAAIETAGNGKDDDCDGSDIDMSGADASREPFAGRWDYPLPEGVGDRRYNVLLVTLDAAAPDHMSLYGYSRPTTPNLERIGSGSAVFNSAYSSGPDTSVSIPGILTSLYGPSVDDVTGNRIPIETRHGNRMLPEILGRAGYHSYAVVSSSFFAGWKDVLRAFDSVDVRPAAWDSPEHGFHSGEQVTSAALGFLNRASRDSRTPFFMWVHYYDLHMPYTKPSGFKPFGDAPSDIYDTEMVYVDDQVGKLISGLDGVFDPAQTIVIVMADHGEAFDQAHEGKPHGTDLSSAAVHIPLIVRAPFVKPGRFDGKVSALDVTPTLVNVLGLRDTFAFQGTSLVQQIVGGVDDPGRKVLSVQYDHDDIAKERPFLMAAIRAGSTIYIRDLGSNTRQLYDLGIDPDEKRNLVSDRPTKTLEMKRLMTRWLSWVERQNRYVPDED